MVSDERTLGEHGARLDAIERSLEDVQRDVKEVLQQLAAGRGGLRVLIALSGISAMIGGLVERLMTR